MCDAKVFIKQPNGTLAPLALPDSLAEKLAIYLTLASHGLTLDEIKYLIEIDFRV